MGRSDRSKTGLVIWKVGFHVMRAELLMFLACRPALQQLSVTRCVAHSSEQANVAKQLAPAALAGRPKCTRHLRSASLTADAHDLKFRTGGSFIEVDMQEMRSAAMG